MNSPRTRSLIAWTLYACVLLNLLSCDIVQGQSSSVAMNRAVDGFCSLVHDAHPAAHKSLPASHLSLKAQMDCPLRTGALVMLLTLFALFWPRYAQSPLAAIEPRSKAPPRYCWPSANPRASPQALYI
ncbi:DUF2946 domain-containing protein [Pseudomonas qingdaonensis]|uniref:DUF2946 domain-containing protein n=1 Tax=Pseudomonas qingdaonensis TaxID=2056231 RepID=A0ABX8DVX6_9PSED|nr:DUF2946 family protein [Pseudomonas qingdaonensis]QVL20342.1 DUF2946 domain-containing protein [Pseudomonas qingdaonensis]